MRIIDYDTHFHITWDMDHWHAHNLKAVKAIGYYHGDGKFICEAKYTVKKDKKFWYVSGSYRREVIALTYSNKAKMIKASEVEAEFVGDVVPMAKLEIAIPWKDDVVTRPYQDDGIAQGMLFERCLLGDEQGLGKTMQAIGIMIGRKVKPVIVVCPSSTKINWSREFQKFSHYRTLVLDGRMPATLKKNWAQYIVTGLVEVVIVNYESVKTFFVESYPQGKTATGKKISWQSKDVVLKPVVSLFQGGILDESQRCKDPLADQTKFILRLFFALKYRLLLSGTPVINRPVDLYPQLAIMGVLNKFGGKDFFIERYCEGGKGANNLRELNYKLKTNCFFRREKKDVAKDLPDKQRQTIICDITNREEYDAAYNDFKKWLADQGFTEDEVMQKMEGESILKMMQLKAIAARGKMNEVKEFVNEVIESGEKLILFCNLHAIVDECLRLWPHAVTVTGRDSMEKRQRNIDAFQNDPDCLLIICNHKAAGVGITLTASSRVGFIEYPWTYSDCVQNEDRAHRIGQKNNVMCTYFLAQNTVDERMWELIISKMTVGNTITGATDMMDNIEEVDKTHTLFNQS